MPDPKPVPIPEYLQAAQAAAKETAISNQYEVAPIPAHTHNATDSLPIDPNDLTNAELYFQVRTITLTSSQIGSLGAAPITLVPAVGSVLSSSVKKNSVIIVEGITAKIYAGGVAYTGANNLEFRYTDASGAKVTADIPSTFIDTAINTMAYAHVAGVTTVLTPVANSPIVACVPVASPGAGNGWMMISTKYRVVSL